MAHPAEQCCDFWRQYPVAVEQHSAAILILEVKTHASEWSLWSGRQPLWMFVENEFADSLPAKGAEAHQHPQWTVETIAGVRSLARTVQRRVATVILHMANPYRCSMWQSFVGVYF